MIQGRTLLAACAAILSGISPAFPESGSFRTRDTLSGGWWGLADDMAARGIDFDLSATAYYAGLLSGTGDQAFEWGGRADAFLHLDTEKAGLWEGGGIHVHAESRFGESADRATPRSGGIWPPNTGVVLPLGHPEQVVASSIYYSHRFPGNTSLLVGKINAVDLLAGDPFFGGWARDRFTNVAFVAPPSGVVPPTIMGMVLSQKLDDFTLTFMAFDPDDRTGDYGVDELFHEGVNLSLAGTWTGEIAGRSSSINLTASSTSRPMKSKRIAPLAITSAIAATAILFSSDDPPVIQTADTIYHGGPILTIDDANPRAEAVAVKDGRIIAVGRKEDVLKTQNDATKLVDLGGKTMLPGFVDAHGHVLAGGIQALSANLLAPPDGKVKDIPSLQQTLRDWMEANKEAVEKIQLVVGFGYDNSQLAELRHPTRDDLDAVSKDIPILVVHQSSHLVAANSKALEIGGISAATPNPPGGVIQRLEGSQEPNGVLEETAAFPLMMKLLGRVGADAAPTFIKAGTELWARFGYTTAQEGRSSPATVKAMQAFADSGELKIDIATYTDVLVDRDFIKKSVTSDYKNGFRVAGAKLVIDGSPQGFTAWRDRPYYKPVGNYPPGYAGYPAAQEDQVRDALDWAYENQIQIITHANGEAASDQLIAYIGAAARKHGAGDRRSTLIHGQFLREDQVDSYQRLGVIPSLFPMHTFYWGDWHRDHTVGPVIAENISPTGWCVERGMMFTSHHDAPVAFPDSMRVLDATVTRRTRSGDILGPHQRVDVMTALKAMTLWPAYQHFEEKTKGSIETGKLADFVILDKDPTAIDSETLDSIKVTQTIKEGATIFLAGETEGAHLSLPDERGEHAFSNFIRLATAESSLEPHAHATLGQCCGCRIAALLGDAIASVPGR